mgnify:CR=1 FL=1
MIGIIDYGLGNIRAFSNIYESLDIPNKIIKVENDFDDVQKIILPGVGAFDYAITSLRESLLLSRLDYEVLECNKPVLGICVGMQMMANKSEEGKLDGLGWIDANVKKFKLDKVDIEKFPLPHMGWNKVTNLIESDLLKNLNNESRFYFLHSYYFDEKSSNNAIAQSSYIGEFTSVVKKNNIYGVQFHPEKSHENGIQILRNFSNL